MKMRVSEEQLRATGFAAPNDAAHGHRDRKLEVNARRDGK
jgi:hypothetical protein